MINLSPAKCRAFFMRIQALKRHYPDSGWCWRGEWQERLAVVVIATPSTGGGLIKMALPFVGDGATNLDSFFSQRETDQKHPSRQRRVSLGVPILNNQ